MWLRFLAFPLALLAGIAAIGACAVGLVFVLAWPNLPSLDVLTDYQPKIPLRVYSAEGVLIGEFGEERRAVVKIGEVPEVLKRSILAAEDERFYQHAGIDYMGVMRAALSNLSSGGRRQGASTITMQVARNFFLSSEKTLTRKLYEALLSFKIEQNLQKDQILELYVNQIYLGQRAYGFGAAAQIYFGKPLDKLTLAEAAMLAGLPKAPSTYNPVVNPQRAKQRQLYVLRRMKDLGHVTEQQYTEAAKAPLANTSRKWCARRCMTSTPTTSTRAGSVSTPRSARQTRKPPTPRCAGAYSTTTAAMDIAAPRPSSSCPIRPLRTTTTRPCPTTATTTTCWRRWCCPPAGRK